MRALWVRPLQGRASPVDPSPWALPTATLSIRFADGEAEHVLRARLLSSTARVQDACHTGQTRGQERTFLHVFRKIYMDSETRITHVFALIFSVFKWMD